MNNVTKEDMKNLPYIIAIDFDGTIVEDRYPEIGELKGDNLDEAKYLQSKGAKVILWTSRDGDKLQEAIDFCRNLGMEFDAVNENLKECQEMFHNDTRKIYANEYWDDKAVGSFSEKYISGYYEKKWKSW